MKSSRIVFAIIFFSFHLNRPRYSCCSSTSSDYCEQGDRCCKNNENDDDFSLRVTNVEHCNDRTNDFYDLVTTDNRKTKELFLDRTLLISRILIETEKGYVVQITQPGGYGKTINADMFRRFLELQVNETGGIIDKNDQINRKLFLGGTIANSNDNGSDSNNLIFTNVKRLDRLNIAYDFHAMQYQGLFPVVYVNFDDIGPGFETYLQYEKAIADKIYRSIDLKYAYLKQRAEEEIICRTLFNFTLFDDSNSRQFGHLERSLEYLCDVLSLYFNSKVFVVVENYEIPIVEAYLEFGISEQFVGVLNLMANIFRNCLKGNSRVVEGGFISGTLPVFRGILKTGHVKEYVMGDADMSQFYGYNDSHVETLIERRYRRDSVFNDGTKVMTKDELAGSKEKLKNRLKLWCRGYRSENNNDNNKENINRNVRNNNNNNNNKVTTNTSRSYSYYYSPALVTDRLSNKSNLYSNSKDFDRATWSFDREKHYLKRTLLDDEIQDDLHNLITGARVIFSYTKNLDFGYFTKHSVLLNILAHNGYITPLYDDDDYEIRFVSCPAIVANKEYRYAFEYVIVRWICQKLDVKRLSIYKEMLKSIEDGKLDDFSRELEEKLLNSTKLTLSDKTRAAVFYRGFALSIAITFSKNYRWITLPNGTSGNEKTVTTLLSKRNNNNNNNKKAILYVYYVTDNLSELDSIAERGLNELTEEQDRHLTVSHDDDDSNHSTNDEIDKVIKICFAFCKKHVVIRYSIDDRKKVVSTNR